MVSQQPGDPTQAGASIALGQDVYSVDGVKVGSIAGIERDVFVIARGPLMPPERLVPRDAVAGVDSRGVHLLMTLSQVQSETRAVNVTPSRAQAGQSEQEASAMPITRERGVAASMTPPVSSAPAQDVLGEQTLELREERLVAHKELQQVGEVEVRTVVDQVPGRLEVDAYSEEVVIEHVPVGQVVDERVDPWEERGDLVIPVYEEQMVVVKRLMLKEEIHIRRVGTTERRLIEETLRRERLVVDDPGNTGLVHERYATTEPEGDIVGTASSEDVADTTEHDEDEGGFGGLIKKMLT